jgi:hypothetical protein
METHVSLSLGTLGVLQVVTTSLTCLIERQNWEIKLKIILVADKINKNLRDGI